ncbi:MAG: sigma-70 family RNA polymerase sigma factor [Pirellulales bacterium]
MPTTNDESRPAAAPQSRGQTPTELLMEQARAGSREALGALLEGCRMYLLHKANRKLDSDLRPRAAPSDLVQDTLLDVQLAFPKFDGTSEADLFAWLAAILDNRLANNVRRHRHTAKRSVNRETPLESVTGKEFHGAGRDAVPADAAISHEEQRRVQLAIQQLAARDRAVLQMRTWERKSFIEIGRELDISADAARKLWGAAVRRLRLAMRDIEIP